MNHEQSDRAFTELCALLIDRERLANQKRKRVIKRVTDCK